MKAIGDAAGGAKYLVGESPIFCPRAWLKVMVIPRSELACPER